MRADLQSVLLRLTLHYATQEQEIGCVCTYGSREANTITRSLSEQRGNRKEISRYTQPRPCPDGYTIVAEDSSDDEEDMEAAEKELSTITHT